MSIKKKYENLKIALLNILLLISNEHMKKTIKDVQTMLTRVTDYNSVNIMAESLGYFKLDRPSGGPASSMRAVHSLFKSPGWKQCRDV